MAVTITIIPEYKHQPETLFINFIKRNYNDIQDATYSQEDKCKYTSVTLDDEVTTRLFFPDYPSAVKWCKAYIRESDYVVKVDDNTGATNNQENWYANLIKTKAQAIASNDPDNYAVCPYCKMAFKRKGDMKKFCTPQHKTNYNLAKLRAKRKAEKEQ